jgi:hypothetical protein
MNAMPGESPPGHPQGRDSGRRPRSRKTELALAIANPTSVTAWARANEVPKRTAYRWADEPEVRAAVESYRRRAVDRPIGRTARRVTWATDRIAKLAKDAESESVSLTALRAMLSDMMAVSQFAELEQRITEIEEKLDEQTARTNFAG